MGSFTSKQKKTEKGSSEPFERLHDPSAQSSQDFVAKPVISSSNERKKSPSFVFVRTGSMYFDEEGSVAHEFYEEVPVEPGGRSVMTRKVTNLTPQGQVAYSYPRLSGDCDVILLGPN